MPTIDDLPPANSVSDADELVLSQSDIARKATRAQLLSGVQAALALPQYSLLGRVSAGIGAPETIAIGANLTVANATISAPSPFVIDALGGAGPVQADDLVAISQGGQNAASNYAVFMGGLSGLTGIDGSDLIVAPTGGVGSRRICDIFGDALSIESFGAVGDGVTDDTAAFQAAADSGAPIRLGTNTYIVNGPILVNVATAWLGIIGETIVRRDSVFNDLPWIDITGPSFAAVGMIFDANKLASANATNFQISSDCRNATVADCQFINALGTGNGLLIASGTGAIYNVVRSNFNANYGSGVSVSGSGTIVMHDCTANGNQAYGISVAAGTACILDNNSCAGNTVGISISNWQEAANLLASPLVCCVRNNICSGNSTWGLAIAANSGVITGNSALSNGSVGVGGGAIIRLASSQFIDNQASGGSVGIDARTSNNCLIAGNLVTGATNGLLVGGCQNVVVANNLMSFNQWGIIVSAVEPQLSYDITGPVSICGNWISFSVAQGGGVWAYDGCLGLSVICNEFNGTGSATIGQALWLDTDVAIVTDNNWNNEIGPSVQSGVVGGLSALVVPDIADEVLVTAVTNPIMSILTSYQSDTLGQVSFVRVTSGGVGYTYADVTIAGSGRGATATAVVYQGEVLWVVLTNPGSGYGAIGSAAPLTISGDGSGAAATAYVGVPVLSGKRLRLSCNCVVQLATTGASPPQQNWTNYPMTVPAFGAVELEGVFGCWRAVAFPATDYLLPTGTGGAVLQSVGGGNVTLRNVSTTLRQVLV